MVLWALLHSKKHLEIWSERPPEVVAWTDQVSSKYYINSTAGETFALSGVVHRDEGTHDARLL